MRDRPQGEGPHRVDHGQVAVQGEQDQGVDGPVGGGVDEELHQLAPGGAQGPPDGVVHRRRRDADGHEQEVGQGQVLQAGKKNVDR